MVLVSKNNINDKPLPSLHEHKFCVAKDTDIRGEITLELRLTAKHFYIMCGHLS